MTKTLSRTVLLVLILGIAVAARVSFLDKSFQGDEFFSMVDAQDLSRIPDALIGDTHPPLYFYLLHFWKQISMSEAFLRLLSVIPGVALVWLVFLLGERTFGRVCAAASALLVALAPVAVWSSQYIRTYSLAAFFMVASTLFLVDIISGRRDGKGAWLGYVAVTAASIYTFYFAALVIIAQNVFVAFYLRRDRAFLVRWFLSQAAIALSYLPWIPFFLFQRSSYVSHPQMVERVGFYVGGIHLGAVIRSFTGLAGFDPRFFARVAVSGEPVLRNILLGVLAAGVGVVALVSLRRIRSLRFREGEREMFGLFLLLAVVPFILAVILHQALGIILMSHYFIASFTFLAILLAVICTRLFAGRKGIVILSCVLLIYAARLGFLYGDEEMDFKGVRQALAGELAGGAALVSPSFGGLADHYFAGADARYHMEDVVPARLTKERVVAVTYPAKLELKDCQRDFRSRMAAAGYAKTGSRSFGDMVVDFYEEKDAL